MEANLHSGEANNKNLGCLENVSSMNPLFYVLRTHCAILVGKDWSYMRHACCCNRRSQLRINNSHLPMGKSVVCFDPSSQKESSSRNCIFTITFCLCLFKSDTFWTSLKITIYKYQHINWLKLMLDLEKLGLRYPYNAEIILLYYLGKKSLSKQLGEPSRSLRSWQFQIDIKTHLMTLLIAQT